MDVVRTVMDVVRTAVVATLAVIVTVGTCLLLAILLRLLVQFLLLRFIRWMDPREAEKIVKEERDRKFWEVYRRMR
jgi:hypothetical protein